jgi:phosphoserine phosphatase RsbU/P
LLVSVNLVVAMMVIAAVVLDYRHQLATDLGAYQSALTDEAHTLLPGIQELKGQSAEAVQNYIDAVCAAMQDNSSPGHHIVADFDGITIQAQSHHRASESLLGRIKAAAVAPGGLARAGGPPLVVGFANEVGIRVYVSEDSEPVIARIRAQAITRLVVLLGIGLAGAMLVNLILIRQVTRPVGDLVDVVRRIGAGKLDARPRSFSTNELDMLAIEIGRMGADLELREQDRAVNLQKAQRLQEHLSPDPKMGSDFSIAVIYRPADAIAGDYYDVLTLPDGSKLVCVADVCGHGVSAAMGAAILKTLLLSACEQLTSPTEILRNISGRFLSVSLPEDFASMVLVRFVPGSGEIEFTSAGHEPTYLLRQSGKVERLESTGMLLGLDPEAQWESTRLCVSGADRLVLLTDGVTEAANPDGQQFSREKLAAHLTSLGGKSVRQIALGITTVLDAYCGEATVLDDQTILVFEPCPPSVEDGVGRAYLSEEGVASS